MLTDHQWSPVTFILGQFHKRFFNHRSTKICLNVTHLNFHPNFSGVNELSVLFHSLFCYSLQMSHYVYLAVCACVASMLVMTSEGVMFAPIQNRGPIYKRGRDCYNVCLKDCNVLKDINLSYCVSQCRQHMVSHSSEPFQALFHCFDPNAFVDSVYFK